MFDDRAILAIRRLMALSLVNTTQPFSPAFVIKSSSPKAQAARIVSLVLDATGKVA
jgi:hypothetical protein